MYTVDCDKTYIVIYCPLYFPLLTNTYSTTVLYCIVPQFIHKEYSFECELQSSTIVFQ